MPDSAAVPKSAPRRPGPPPSLGHKFSILHPVSFLFPTEYRGAEHEGIVGFNVNVRLPSYRSLPLSCVRAIELSVDGEEVDARGLRLILDGTAFPIDAVAERMDVWWYVLDVATLFVPKRLTSGPHEIQTTFVAIVPYATGGRRTFTLHSTLQIAVPSEDRT